MGFGFRFGDGLGCKAWFRMSVWWGSIKPAGSRAGPDRGCCGGLPTTACGSDRSGPASAGGNDCPARDRVQGSGFRVQGAGFRVQGAGFRVQGAGCRVQGAGFRVQGSGFGPPHRKGGMVALQCDSSMPKRLDPFGIALEKQVK